MLSIKNDLDEQKFQLFYLKLTSGESNIINLLLNIHDNSTANDFIVLEREIKKYEKLIQSLESESELSEEYKLLWDEHNNNTANYFDELKTKKIHCFLNTQMTPRFKRWTVQKKKQVTSSVFFK